MQAVKPAVMSIADFCTWANIGRTKTYEEISTKRLATLKVGRRRLVLVKDAERWLEAHIAGDVV